MPPLVIQTTGLDEYAPGGTARVKVLVIGGPAAGKRLDVDTKVATPSGWRRFGDLVIGDEVIGSNGSATRVLGIFDEGTGTAYRLTLNDRSSVICDPDHLWAVQTRKGREGNRAPVVRSTQQIFDAGVRQARDGHKARYEFFLPLVAPVQYEKVDGLPVGPYLLGSLLANGSFTTSSSVYLTTNDEAVAERCIDENPNWILRERTHATSTCRRWQLLNGHTMLRELGLDQLLSADKHIPSMYMTAQEPVRRALLAGLIDGDGSVTRGCRARFSSTSIQLARGVQELVWSLGGVARIDVSDRGAKGIEFSVSLWTPDNPFSLARKADAYSPDPWFRAIESIEPVGEAQMRCIQVDADDKLYVVEHYIVTHNTRWSSTFPKPIYADCEKGLASVADRKMPYAAIKSSQDMLDLLAMMKQECRQLPENRKYETFVVDTLDAFQRKVKNEWMELNKKEVFTGWEAWGYLNSKMQLLMTRLLNLDMNVIVNVHYKDKTTKDDESGKESHTLMLQLQGELADTAYNDFDLVGWMGTYWEAVNGERIQKRGLTFRATPDKPFLKDRLHVTPKWMEVSFEPSDYTVLFDAIQSRVEEMDPGEILEVVPGTTEELSSFVIPVGAVGSGAMPVSSPKDLPLAQMDKPTLMKQAREAGVTTTVDGSPIKGNTLKSELIAALEASKNAAPTTETAAPTEVAEPTKAPESPTTASVKPVIEQAAVPQLPDTSDSDAPTQALARLANPTRIVAEGTVDVVTGELIDPPTHEQAVATVEDTLGGKVIQDKALPVTPPAAVVTATVPDAGVCDDCGKSLEGQNPDFIKLSWIKYRKKLCETSYQARKSR